jgi:hypothetical protein
MLQFLGMERVNPFYTKNATILGGWKWLTLSIPERLQFWGAEKGLLILSQKCYNFGAGKDGEG